MKRWKKPTFHTLALTRARCATCAALRPRAGGLGRWFVCHGRGRAPGPPVEGGSGRVRQRHVSARGGCAPVVAWGSVLELKKGSDWRPSMPSAEARAGGPGGTLTIFAMNRTRGDWRGLSRDAARAWASLAQAHRHPPTPARSLDDINRWTDVGKLKKFYDYMLREGFEPTANAALGRLRQLVRARPPRGRGRPLRRLDDAPASFVLSKSPCMRPFSDLRPQASVPVPFRAGPSRLHPRGTRRGGGAATSAARGTSVLRCGGACAGARMPEGSAG